MQKNRGMELLCRRHAELDEKTANAWTEQAELWARLAQVEHRLQVLSASCHRLQAGADAER